VSVAKKGERWERMRIGLLCRDEIAKVRLRNLGAGDRARRSKCDHRVLDYVVPREPAS
jgi:hypothetical protein